MIPCDCKVDGVSENNAEIPLGFDPWSGSVSPKQPRYSPDASLGKYFIFCSSLPNLKISPNIKRLYTFNNPDDNSSVQALAALTQTAPKFNIELVIRDTSTPEELATALSEMPEDIDAIFLLASAIFEKNNDLFVKFANENRLPLAAPATANVRDGALISFGHDNVPLGQQAAHLADQILRGTKPADLPIESAELYVSINLKTAEIIGLSIPDEIIRQADIIVR